MIASVLVDASSEDKSRNPIKNQMIIVKYLEVIKLLYDCIHVSQTNIVESQKYLANYCEDVVHTITNPLEVQMQLFKLVK